MMGFVAAVLIGVMTLMPGHTEPIVNSNGQVVADSIAVMEKIELGGVDQWLVMRGKSRENPVLLLLSGGPGGTEMGRFLKFNQKLEDHFIVVNWEQRGSGKSYPAIKKEADMTVDQYVADINQLTNYLKDRFNKEKIYLLGHSWGTIIGTKAVHKYPDQFHAYIGAAQMVNVRETDQYIYNYMLGAAQRAGSKKLAAKLEAAGEPPYYGDDILKRYKPFLTNYAQYYKREHPFTEQNGEWYNPMSILMIDEYNFVDKVRTIKGMINTFELVYPQLQEVDFVTQAAELEVPVYYLIGKHDYTAKFIEEYFAVLEAPSKKLYWFENSAHGEIWSEADKFHRIMTEEVL